MKRLILLLAVLSVLLAAACSKSGPSSSGAGTGSSQAGAPQAAPQLPKPPPGECVAEGGVHGYVRINSNDLTGPFEICTFDLASGTAAFRAKKIDDKDSALILLSRAKAETLRCEKNSPAALNYSAQNPPGMLYVASADKFGKCQISTSVINDKHWAGKAYATLVPGGRDSGKAGRRITMQVEWDIQKP